MLTNRKTIHVEWGDCDPAGIVYYPRYFAYFDNCTAALFEAAGLPKHQMLKWYDIVGIPMVDTRARFLAPSKFGDDIVVESRISEWRRSSFDVGSECCTSSEERTRKLDSGVDRCSVGNARVRLQERLAFVGQPSGFRRQHGPVNAREQ